MSPAQVHMAGKWQYRDLNSGSQVHALHYSLHFSRVVVFQSDASEIWQVKHLVRRVVQYKRTKSAVVVNVHSVTSSGEAQLVTVVFHSLVKMSTSCSFPF